MPMSRLTCITCLSWLLFACSTTPAPVIDRTPYGNTASTPTGKTSTSTATTKAASKSAAKPVNGKNGSDWRPDTHTVKKGDTLFSIGLEYGYDYKDIARVNNISAPYVIKIGQILKLAELNLTEPKDKQATLENKPAQVSEDGVMTYPLNTESGVTTTASSEPAASASTAAVIAISQPKAIREPYSDEAFKTALTAEKPVTPPATTAKATVEPKSAVTEAKETKPEAKEAVAEIKNEPKPAAETAGGITWSWPTKGKVISGFNEGGNKGIDIAGTKGQPIVAAAPGKVIYSGSDLRGYGKLVIIKHNNTYLSVYANNSNIVVKEGQQVSAGQKIAEMGDTDSNVVKLHFEIRQQGKSVDPAKFLAAN